MRLVTRGTARGFTSPIVGVVTTDALPPSKRAGSILVVESAKGADVYGYRAAVLGDQQAIPEGVPAVYGTRDIGDLRTGYIVALDPSSGHIRTLYRPDSCQNFLFVTELCNSNCLMCSQPPKNSDDRDELMERNLAVLDMIEEAPAYLTITGGEPTVLGDRLATLIRHIGSRFPECEVHILSNGRHCTEPAYVKKLAMLRNPRVSWGIPLYADVPWLHDYVVQSHGAFSETISGICNLARWGQRVEIRIVLSALTCRRLPELANFIYRNLTFTEHVALMGLEHTGFAVGNMDRLWIDPADYQMELSEAVHRLSNAGIPVSLYNLQLCTIPKALWPYAVRSISDWKNAYRPQCQECCVRSECTGFFQWDMTRVSRLFGPLPDTDRDFRVAAGHPNGQVQGMKGLR